MPRLRRLVDGFLRIATPPRRDCTLMAREQDAAWGEGRAVVREEAAVLRTLRAGPRRGFNLDDARRLGYWPGQEHRADFVRTWREQGDQAPDALERPWNFHWDRVAKRSAGPGFTREDYRTARLRARDIARQTLGEELWQRLEGDGYLDLPSRQFHGLTYRLRVGRRIEVLCADGVRSPWDYDFLCINPAYPLPEYEFLAQLFLYVRDQEDEIVRVAAPQPWDQALGRTF